MLSLIHIFPYGELRTYADLAAQITREDGGKTSARAVGTANGRNPISIILPCHRAVSYTHLKQSCVRMRTVSPDATLSAGSRSRANANSTRSSPS